MKTIKIINAFAVGLPFLILITYPIAKEGAFIFALLSTMATGFVQVLLGIKMLFNEPRDLNLRLYISSVIIYFTTVFIYEKLDLKFLEYILIAIPAVLAIYLTLIIYKKAQL